MTNQIQFFISSCGRKKSSAVIKNMQGSAMIYLISVILIMSVLGTAMLNLTETSTLGNMSANHMERAFFMAEAGGRYAISRVKDDIEHDGTFDDNKKPSIHKQTFVLDEIGFGEEGSFTITVKVEDVKKVKKKSNSIKNFTITSIGRIKAKVSSDVEAKIVYNLTVDKDKDKDKDGGGGGGWPWWPPKQHQKPQHQKPQHQKRGHPMPPQPQPGQTYKIDTTDVHFSQ